MNFLKKKNLKQCVKKKKLFTVLKIYSKHQTEVTLREDNFDDYIEY